MYHSEKLCTSSSFPCVECNLTKGSADGRLSTLQGTQGGPGTDTGQLDHCTPKQQGKVDLAYYISFHILARSNYVQGKGNCMITEQLRVRGICRPCQNL